MTLRAAAVLQRLAGNRAVSGALHPKPVQRDAGEPPPVALPETTSVRLTGGYEAVDPGGNNRITIQWNQAGYHLEGWYQRREASTFAGVQRQTMQQDRITAEMVSAEVDHQVYRYRRFSESRGSTTSTGTLTARADRDGPRFTLVSDGGWSKSFRQTSTSSRPPQTALEALPEGVQDVLAASVEAPLDSAEEEHLAHNVEVLKRRIRDYWREGPGIGRTAIATHVNADTRTMLTQFAEQQKPLARHRVREALASDTLDNEGNVRTYWSWLQLVVVAEPSFTEAVQGHLSIDPTGAGDLRTYRYAISVGGLSGDALVGAGVMVGDFEIEYLGTGPDAQRATRPVWSRRLPIGIVMFSGGASVGVTTGLFTPWSTFQTPYPWEPQTFEGMFLIGGAQASGSLGPGAGVGASIMTIYGDGSLPPLPLPGVDALVETGVHAGVEAGGMTGRIGGTDVEIHPDLTPPEPARGEAGVADGRAVHFEIDEPMLTFEGIEAVRRMAALQLSTLESPGTTLRIDGYASTTGTDAHNETLSASRAAHVLQQIRDVTVGSLAIPEENISVRGHGERAARTAGSADEVEDVAWRRVDVRLDGRIVQTLR